MRAAIWKTGSCNCGDQGTCEAAGATWSGSTCGGELQGWTWLIENNGGA